MVQSVPKDLILPKWVTSINNEVLEFLGRHNDYQPLGPSYSGLSFKDAEWNLQLHRMHKKFEQPDDSHAQERKSRSLWAMVDYDSNGLTEFFVPGSAKINPYVRHQLYCIRKRLNEIVSDYRFSVSSLEFPSGETFVSANGDISLYAKLRDIEQWTCTLECFDLFARVCYNTPMLKFAARAHFKTYCKKIGKKFDEKRMWKMGEAIWSNPSKRAFELFKSKLRVITTFVDGARITTVPKDTEVDRVITCEPFCNMIVQRTIEIGVRDLILKHYGIDLDESQIIHRALIEDLDNATIDLKNASNSVYYAVVKWFLDGSRLWKHLDAARSAVIDVENGMQWKLNMLSPMGNGYTFGVMTLLLLCVIREYDDFGHVFGDDIIVHKDVASDVIELLQNIGFETNVKKTFISGNFRESCGGFTSEGRYITSFDLEWAKDEVDAVVLTNKIGIMAYATNSRLRSPLQKLHSSLLENMPPSLLRGCVYRKNYAGSKITEELKQLKRKLHNGGAPTPYYYSHNSIRCLGSLSGTDNFWSNDRFALNQGCYVRDSVLQKNQCTTRARKTKQFLRSKVGKDLHLEGEQYDSYLLLEKRATTYVTKGNKPLKPVHNVSRLFGWYYIWAGKILAPNLRETTVSQRWVTEGPKILG